MKAILAATLIGTLVRPLTLRTIGTTDIAEGTLAMDSVQNGRTLTNYVPVVLIGAAARRVFDRTTAGSVLSIQGAPRQEKWEDAEGGKRSRMRIQALRTEVLSGDFATVTDQGGGQRLAQGVNEVTLGGNLVATPEVRYTPGGDAVTTFSLALNEKFRTRKNEVKERVSFVDVTAWKDLAEFMATLPKGTPLTVLGAAVSESWTDKDGQKRSALKFEASRIFQVQPPEGRAAQPDTHEPISAAAAAELADMADEDMPF
ncbi:single-stranded DNA-binding protein [Deinococcus ficus]|uniref:Single-stranded DNA-binding protein n=1 Tax=Deinococcus ficus TaxID=317577 RepID=A0A221T375_9DEIO|nr:single-stranded DNA-binding protein [Deinococcus ficus]ASN83321.1 hypothetical protein DFI_19175 [Deinococcus ficus]